MPRSRRVLIAAMFSFTAAAVLGGLRLPDRVQAYAASGPLVSNGPGTGSGASTSISGRGALLQLSLQGASANATYAVFSCLALIDYDFDCVGRNNPTTAQQIVLAPKVLDPVKVTLAQQGQLITDGAGNASATVPLPLVLLPDTPHSIFNVVQLINIADARDSYTAVDLQTPAPPVSGVNPLPSVAVTTVLGVPVYVFALLPGYLFPIAITTLAGAPFTASAGIPPGVLAQPGFAITNGLCPNGSPPTAVPQPNATINFTC